MFSEVVQALSVLTEAFDRIGVRYFVGGSVASSVHGFPRFTQDVDLVAELTLEDVPKLVEVLSAGFFVDEHMVRDAIRLKNSFNIFHTETMTKADVFIFKGDEWSKTEMNRAVIRDFAGASFNFSSAEDTILQKLSWYKLGGQVSDRQWRDVIGLLQVRRAALDQTYLDHWAVELRVDELLRRAQAEA